MKHSDIRKAMALVTSKQDVFLRRWKRSMADLTTQEIDIALERGKIAAQAEPRATGVRYDRRSHKIVVNLHSGCLFAFPPSVVQGLKDASDDQLSSVEILGAGYGLHWEMLDVDLSVSGLLAGVFGTASFMARRAGRVTSLPKAAAARANGAKGGRPRKSPT